MRKESGSEVDASLFRHLDLNGDGLLTADELHHAKEALAPLDADDDETISTAELMAASQKRAPAAQTASPRPQAADRQIDAGPAAGRQAAAHDPRPRHAGRVDRPGPRSRLRRDARRAAAESPPPPWVSRRRCSAASRRAARPPGRRRIGPARRRNAAELELSFQLFDQQHGRPRVAVARADHPPRFEWQQASADSGLLAVDGLKVALSAKRTRGATGDMASFYALRFNIVDQDKNNYLDRARVCRSRPAGGRLRRRRRQRRRPDHPDRIGRLSSREKTTCTSTRCCSRSSDESQSLFDFLDTRPDGRLSPARTQRGGRPAGGARPQPRRQPHVGRAADANSPRSRGQAARRNRGGMRIVPPRQQAAQHDNAYCCCRSSIRIAMLKRSEGRRSARCRDKAR